jgi:anti-anti-sigma factor
MKIVTRRYHQTELIHLSGGLDDTNFANLAALLATHLRQCRETGLVPQFILECSEVTYIGSVELKTLLELAQRARAFGGDLKCAALAPTIEHVATLIANGDPLDCHPSVHAAQQAFETVSAL